MFFGIKWKIETLAISMCNQIILKMITSGDKGAVKNVEFSNQDLGDYIDRIWSFFYLVITQKVFGVQKSFAYRWKAQKICDWMSQLLFEGMQGKIG